MSTLSAKPIFQIYRGGVPGNSDTQKRSNLVRVVALAKTLGLDTVCFHGFPRELASAWDGLAAAAANEGVAAMASWGLDGETDGAKPFTGAAKGRLVGSVLAKKTCIAGLLDAEGRWDDGDADKPGDVTDKDDAISLGAALREVAPSAIVGDQPWFAIDSHGELRKAPRAGDSKDVFKGFPVDEFARVVNWRRFRQMYCNQAGFKAQWGTSRYEKVTAWMDRDWKKLEGPFKAAGLPFDLGVTIQGYGWGDALSDLVHQVLDACATKNQELIVWCDYEPSREIVAAVKALSFLRARGFTTLGHSADRIVRAFQLSYNQSAVKPLDVDGACGPKTLAAMGIYL